MGALTRRPHGAVAGGLVAAVVLVLAGLFAIELRSAPAGARRGDLAARPVVRLDLAAVRSFDRFAVYWAGAEHAGLQLAAITRRRDAGDDRGYRADFMSFLYGMCRPMGGAGCPLPLEIQSWPACVRTLADYRLTPFSDELLPHARLTVRGVPAAAFDEARGLVRLELYTGRETVVLFGRERAQLLAAARALRGANTPVAPGVDLPPPRSGAMEGRLSCDSG